MALRPGSCLVIVVLAVMSEDVTAKFDRFESCWALYFHMKGL
jgi:hypothetical protein